MSRTHAVAGLLRCSALKWIIFSILIFHFSAASAQTEDEFILYPTEVEAILKFDQIKQRSSGNSNQNSRETELDIGARINQQGHYLDPEIAWFLLDFEPVYSKDDLESTTFSEDTSGEILNYLFQLGIFRGTPDALGYDLQAQRNSSLSTGSLGSRYDNVIDSKKAAVRWKNHAFPMTFSYQEELLDQEFRNSQNNQVTRRDELVDTFAISGSSSKLNVKLSHRELDDRVISRNNDFEVEQAHANHRLSWGRGSELSSRFDLYDRTGFNANERLSLDELVRIYHRENVYSRTSYRYYSLKQNIDTEQHIAKFQLNHKLHRNLTSSASLEIDSSDSDNVDEEIHGIELASLYNKQKLFGARVNAGLGLGYRVTDRDSKLGLIDIADESQVIPLAGAVNLDNRFIVTSSIIVTNADSTLVFDEGFDYEVNSVAGDLTEIRIIPGSRIQQGDTILVSYQAQILPSQEFTTTKTRYNLGIDLGWVRFSHSDNRSDDTLQSGADESFLNDTRSTITDLEFRWKINNDDLSFKAERRFRKSGGFDSTSYTYQQTASWIINKKIRWNLNATESFTEQVNRDTDLYSLDLYIDWRPTQNLSVRPILGYWELKDSRDIQGSGIMDDEFVTAGFRMHWKFRQIIMDFSFFHNQRDVRTDQNNNITRTKEDRLMLNLSRRFL